jgi:hypothetical protein
VSTRRCAACRCDAVPTGSVNTSPVEVCMARYRSRTDLCKYRATAVGRKHDGTRARESRTGGAVSTGSVNTQFEEFLCRRRLFPIVKVREKR